MEHIISRSCKDARNLVWPAEPPTNDLSPCRMFAATFRLLRIEMHSSYLKTNFAQQF